MTCERKCNKIEKELVTVNRSGDIERKEQLVSEFAKIQLKLVYFELNKLVVEKEKYTDSPYKKIELDCVESKNLWIKVIKNPEIFVTLAQNKPILDVKEYYSGGNGSKKSKKTKKSKKVKKVVGDGDAVQNGLDFCISLPNRVRREKVLFTCKRIQTYLGFL